MIYVRKVDFKSIVVCAVFVCLGCVITALVSGGINKSTLREAVEQHERSTQEREAIFKEFRDGVQGVADELSTNEVLFRESDDSFDDIFGYLSALGGIFDTVGEEIERLRGLLEEFRSPTP
ncbi:MAG: hypothetical protein DRN81_03145 [Thermoproteota archaeon]|nr:MAG: hypothetical protein DRN81_03145 [Candidatus Korarchaeota archaeon]